MEKKLSPLVRIWRYPLTQWVCRTSYYLIIIILLFWMYVCKGSNIAPFVYNEF